MWVERASVGQVELDFVAATRDACARFAALARTTPHDLPVAHVPGWSVHHLVAHLTGDHVWAHQVITTRGTPASGLLASRRRGDALLAQFDAVTADLLDALATAATDPETPCPNFAQGDAGRLGWWPRHQAHEALVHLWDLESVTGDHAPRDPAVAADGVTELFETYTNRYAGQRLARPLLLRSPSHGVWRVDPGDGPGRVLAHPVDDDSPADLTAPPDVLLLALWHRIDADDPRLRYADHADDVRAFLRGPLTA